MSDKTKEIEELYNKYHVKLKYLVSGIDNISKQEAEEIVHDVFLQLFCEPNKYKPSLGSYQFLRTCVLNRTATELRKLYKKMKHVDIMTDILEENLYINRDYNSYYIEKQIDDCNVNNIILNALESLEDDEFFIFTSIILRNQSYQSVADGLGLQLNDVTTILRRAKDKTKRWIIANYPLIAQERMSKVKNTNMVKSCEPLKQEVYNLY